MKTNRGVKQSKRVLVIDSEGKRTKYNSAVECGLSLGMNGVVIQRYCRNQTKVTQGKRSGCFFTYLPEEIEEGIKGDRGTPPSTVGELIDDLKLYPSSMGLKIDSGVLFGLKNSVGKQELVIEYKNIEL
jgi:hypothetical protein